MEKIEFNTMPRMAGKTTEIIKRFVEDCRNRKEVVLIVNKNADKREIMEKFHESREFKNKIFHSSEVCEKLKGKTVDKIYIDEWLFFSEKEMEDIYYLILNKLLMLEKVVTYTTPDKLYDYEELMWFHNLMSGGDITPELYKRYKSLWLKFLFNPYAELHTTIYNRDTYPFGVEKFDRLKLLLSEEKFQTEIRGRLFK